MTTGSQVTKPQNIPFAPKPEPGERTIRALILILPCHLVQTYNNTEPSDLIKTFEKGIPFEHSLGHCWITWDKNSDVCSIWDVCLHQQSGGGMGSILTDCIIDMLATHLPNTTKLWLGIDIRNKSFNKIISLYTKFGFKDPYISFIDPHGNHWQHVIPYGFVALSRSNDYMDPEDIERQKVQIDILYMLTQYVKIQRINFKDPELESVKEVAISVGKSHTDFCSIKMKFKLSFAKWLSKLSLNASTLNADGTVSQKEVGGAFLLDYPERQTDDFIWEVNLDKGKGILTQYEESVDIVPGRYNFHTHPREAYGKHRVSIGYPSGSDYFAFLLAVNNLRTIFHCVIALEGIYTISLSSYWCTRIIELDNNFKEGGNPLKQYITTNFNLPKVIPKGMTIDQAGKDYCVRINQQKLFNSQPPVFHCQFMSWNEIFSGTVIEVGYPVLFNQCFATERSLNTLENFHLTAY
jgi:hypothetical protein